MLKPSVLQVLPSLGVGGVERGTVDIANYLVKNGCRSVVIASSGCMVSRLHNDVTYIEDDYIGSKNPILIATRNAKKIREIVKQYDINIVHVRSRAPAFSCKIAFRKIAKSCKLLTTFHGIYGAKFLLKRYYNSIMIMSDKVIAVSDFVKNHIINTYRYDGSNVVTINRGVDTSFFNPNSITEERISAMMNCWAPLEDKRIILLPSRLSDWKGHDLMLDAMNILRRDDIVCVMFYDTSGANLRSRLEDRISRYNLHSSIKFVPYTDDIATAYFLSSLVVVPSTKPEAFGRTPVESMAMGRLTIAADIGAMHDTIVHGKTGWLFDVSNPKALADAINIALDLSEDESNLIKRNAIKHVMENFTCEKMCQETLALYYKMLQ